MITLCSLRQAVSAHGGGTRSLAAGAPQLCEDGPSPSRDGGASDRELSDSLSLLQQVARTSAHEGRRSRQPPGPGGKGPFIAYLSAAGNGERRAQIRKKCLKEVKDRGIPYAFFVGRPTYTAIDPTFNPQGWQAPPQEIEATKHLRKEQEEFGDIRAVPYADHYRDCSDKVSMMFDYGLDAGYDLIVKIDDDHCLNLDILAKVAAEAKDSVALYIGEYLWNGTEYPSMFGPGGHHAPFMMGPCYMLSRRSASILFRDRAFDTQMFQDYGTSSEDSNVGKWYQRAVEAQSKETLFKDMRFERREEHGLCSSVRDATP